jgi:hypothetical protein
MQMLQRKAGKLLSRSADDAQVALLMKDFDEGDKLLQIVPSLPSPFFLNALVEYLAKLLFCLPIFLVVSVDH